MPATKSSTEEQLQTLIAEKFVPAMESFLKNGICDGVFFPYFKVGKSFISDHTKALKSAARKLANSWSLSHIKLWRFILNFFPAIPI